jgi:hypothetical protein
MMTVQCHAYPVPRGAHVKTHFLSDWNRMKRDFDAAAKAVQAPDDITTKFLAAMAKPTGLTPILKDIDAAFAKEHRKDANAALLKFYGKREPIALLLAKIVPKITDDNLQMAAMTLMKEIPALEKKMQTAFKTLQDDKAGGSGASDWNLMLLFETDLKKNIDQLAKDLKSAPLAKIEKTHDVMSLTKIPVKDMDAYSKAAARLKADEALAALKAFQTSAEGCAKACEAILKKVTDADYDKAVTRFVKDLRTLCKARVAVQQKKLQEHVKG